MTPTYNGPECRHNSDFERDMYTLMGEVREYLKTQPARCNSHAADIRMLKDQTKSLEDSRTFIKGMIAFATKFSLLATGISGIVYGWVSAFGNHADKLGR